MFNTACQKRDLLYNRIEPIKAMSSHFDGLNSFTKHRNCGSSPCSILVQRNLSQHGCWLGHVHRCQYVSMDRLPILWKVCRLKSRYQLLKFVSEHTRRNSPMLFGGKSMNLQLDLILADLVQPSILPSYFIVPR